MSTYCTRADIETRYGTDNVDDWADLDNKDVAAVITTTITEAIAVACEDIDDVLRGSNIHVPCVNESGTTPTTIKDLAAWMAGLWLYETRGSMELDNEHKPIHRYAHVRAYADRRLNEIRSGQRILAAKAG